MIFSFGTVVLLLVLFCQGAIASLSLPNAFSTPITNLTFTPFDVTTDYVVPWVQTSPEPGSWDAIASDASGQYLVGIQAVRPAVLTSSDYGVTWVMRFTLLEFRSYLAYFWHIVCSDSSGRNLVVGSSSDAYQSYIYFSHDYGITWTLSDAPNACWKGIASDASGQQVIITAMTGPIYISHNYGQNWTLTSAPTGAWTSAASSASGQFLVATMADHGGIFTSKDYGVTWVKSMGAPFAHFSSVASDDTGKYIVACDDVYRSVYTSRDFGVTFIEKLRKRVTATSVYSDSTGANLAAVNKLDSYSHMHLSTDYGATWSMYAAPNMSWNAAAFGASGQRLVAVTSSSGMWTYYNPFLPVSPSRAPTVAPSNPSVAPTVQPTTVPTTYVVPWVQTSAPAYQWSSVASDASGQYLVAYEESLHSIWTSTDYGTSWVKRLTFTYNVLAYFVSSDSSGQRLVVVGKAGSVQFSRDFGHSWTSAEVPYSYYYGINGLARDTTGQHVIVVGRYRMSVSHDYGENWMQLTSAPAGLWTCAAISSSGQFLIASLSTNDIGLYTSNDYGVTWVKTADTARQWTSISSDATGQYLVAGESMGNVYTSSDYGATFVNSQVMGSHVCSDSSGANIAAYLYTGARDSKIVLSADYGATWVVSAAPSAVWASMAFDASGKRLVAAATRYEHSGIWAYFNASSDPATSPTTSPSEAPVVSTESPTKEPSRAPTGQPTRTQTVAPICAPTPVPTRIPTSSPTRIPTGKPTCKPSRTPTSSPTRIPTRNPTRHPTRTPTSAPTGAPTCVPTLVPTRIPTSAVPTMEPTATSEAPTMVQTIPPSAHPSTPPSPLVSFTSHVTLHGLGSATLDVTGQMAVVKTTAALMGVPVSTVSYVKTVELSADVANNANLRHSVRQVETSYAVIAITETHVMLDQTSYATTEDLYSGLTTNLVDSVKSGVFSEALVSTAQELGATDLYSTIATDATSSAPTVTAAGSPEDSSRALAVDAMVGIALFGAALFVLWAVLYARYRQRLKSPSAQSVRQKACVFDEDSEELNPMHARSEAF